MVEIADRSFGCVYERGETGIGNLRNTLYGSSARHVPKKVKAMANPKQVAARSIYNEMMSEAKHRIHGVNLVMQYAHTLPSIFIEEFTYLQLRMLCELVAVACLVAHGDIETTEKLKDDWAADRIIKALEKLHPDFYPTPVASQVTMTHPDGHTHLRFTRLQSGFLTKDELVALYRKCSSHLHLGSFNKLLYGSERKPQPSQAIAYFHKMATLLGTHRISMIDGKVKYICVLETTDGQTQTIITEPVDD